MENLKVSSRLYLLLAIATAAFSILLLIAELGMGNLGELQDEGHRRSSESAEIQVAAKIGSVMYQVIADSIINRNLTDSAAKWAELKNKTETMFARAREVADTPDEKKWADQGVAAYQNLVSLYESKLLPLLKADADMKEIRLLDDEIDKLAKAIEDAMTPFADSEAESFSFSVAEAKPTDGRGKFCGMLTHRAGEARDRR